MEIMIESMMLAERREFLDYAEGNKGNGFRHGRAFGQGRVLEFRIPRDRYGNFHPKILALLRDQEMECERLAGILYCKGLTQSQVGDVFEEVYGSHYSKASISRMIEYLRSDVEKWLNRSLESYYPIVFVDAVHVKVHRKPFMSFSVSKRTRNGKFSVFTTIPRRAPRAGKGSFETSLTGGWNTSA